jgi:PAS domain S-box-containing protein
MKMDSKTKAAGNPTKSKTNNSKHTGSDTGKKPDRSITRTKRAKGQLSGTEQGESIGSWQRLLATYEHAPIGIIENSLEGNYVNCNEEFCRIIGYGKEELFSLAIKDLTYEEDYIFDIKLHQRLVVGEIPFYKLEKRYIRKDGQLIWAEVTRSLVRNEAGKPLYTIGAVLDVSERRLAEEQLRRTASFNKAVMSNMGEGLYTVDSNGLVTSMNSEAEKLFGWTFGEISGRKMHDVTHYKYPDGTPFPAEDCAGFQVLHHGQLLVNFEDVFIRKDGTFFDVQYSSSPLWENGSISGLVVVFSEITERKRAEKAIIEFARQQEALYKLADQLHRTNSLEDVFNAALDAISSALQCDRASILLFDNTGVMRFVAWRGLSDSYRKSTEGHSPWRPDTKNPEPISFNDIGTAELSDSLKAVIEGEGIGSLAFIPLVSNGKLIGKFMAYFNAPHVFSEGELELSLTIAHQLAFGIDRKRSEEALRASEALYRSIARSIPGGGVYVVDKDFRYLVAEGPVTEAFGLSREMLEGHTVSEIFDGEIRMRMEERFQRAFAGETTSSETERNGHVYWSQYAPLVDSIGQAIVVTLDVTNQKQAEEALRESKERYRNLFDLVPVAVYTCDADGLIQEFNHRAVELWGREPEKNNPKEKFCGSFKMFYPDGRFMPHAACPMARMLGGETLEPHELEILIERPDGVRKRVLAHPLALKNERGEIIGAINCVYDITDRKQAEEKIIFQANLLGAVGSAVIATDLNGIVLYWNPAAEKMYGWSSSDALGKNVVEVAPAPQSQEQAGEIMKQLVTGKSWSGDFLVQRRDGSTFPAFVSDSPILDSNGKLVGIIGVSSDITDLKQAEEALQQLNLQLESRVQSRTEKLNNAIEALREEISERKQAEELLRRWAHIFEHADWGIATVRQDTFMMVNPTYAKMHGYTAEELVGHSIYNVFAPESRADLREQIRIAYENGHHVYESKHIRRDGSIFPVLVDTTVVRDEAGNVLYRAVNVQDITERKRTEDALRESEATAHLLLDTAPDAVVITDEAGQIVHANAQIESLFGYQPGEVLGKAIETLIPDRFHERHAEHRRSYEANRYRRTMGLGMELFGRRKDHNEFPVDVMLTPISNVTGWDVMATIRDSTERIHMEDALRESHERLQKLSQRLVEVQEDERRALARELHDRVGQTLAALNINLMIMNGQLLEDSKQRIGSRLDDSMKLVAEAIALVRNVMTDLRPAVLDDYGLEAALQSYIDEFKSRCGIKVLFDQSDTTIPRLDPGLEMTVLRIAQEALTNVARHAQADSVNVSLRLQDNAVHLMVQDNGVGIQSWQEANRPGSHGLTIMRERADAFGGSLNVGSVPGKGTKVEVNIPLQNGNQNKVREEQQV